jgi:hypothetical protein
MKRWKNKMMIFSISRSSKAMIHYHLNHHLNFLHQNLKKKSSKKNQAKLR